VIKLFFVLVVLSSLSSCAVDMVRKTYSPVKGGTVRYSTGWFMEGKNRAKAIEEMNQYCSPGRGKILSEESKKEATGQSFSNSRLHKKDVSTTTTHGHEGAVYLNFKCVR
jgi:hypothetical protein